jgi:dTDP-D-glucose 4,6-dehydratase
MILVTGGAGFIGANFVIDWLAQSDERVVTLDLLTYAGNLGNLAPVKDDARHVFVRGDIGERVMDHQRYQLFRKLARPVVVRAVGRQHRHAVGVVIGAHQVIRSRLRR